MQLDPDTFNEETWRSVEDTMPKFDLLSRKEKHPLFWTPSFSYYPIRSIYNYPITSKSDFSKLVTVTEFNCHLFKVSDPDEERLLRAIKDRIYSGWYIQIAEETKWDKSDNVLVWLTWAQQYSEFSNTETDV